MDRSLLSNSGATRSMHVSCLQTVQERPRHHTCMDSFHLIFSSRSRTRSMVSSRVPVILQSITTEWTGAVRDRPRLLRPNLRTQTRRRTRSAVRCGPAVHMGSQNPCRDQPITFMFFFGSRTVERLIGHHNFN
jgi:hypothetical protein